jgi:hypothetical protein
MEPYDIIEGARSPAHQRVFVIGAFDSRITFYSQQVRALSLVHALHEQGVLRRGMRVAVVGGGAAGLTAAAGLAVLADVEINLYERAQEVLPLQSATTRRRLDPHIYGWPEAGSDDLIADLPLLDWTAAPAQEVRRDVKQEFEAIAGLRPGLWLNLRHEITGARAVGPAVQLDFERDARHAESANERGRVRGQAVFDLVILAFGFGVEVAEAGVPAISYWSEAGVPVAEFEGRATPRFLISGNGDGGLIDLVAAASAHFDHAAVIHEITHQPNFGSLIERLEDIDARARAADGAGNGFDFLAVYDAEILEDLKGLGLLDRVVARLRPGVQLTLQTLGPEVFSVKTSTLNRLAAYLVIQACAATGHARFVHLADRNLEPIQRPDPAPYEARFWFRCDGQEFGVDTVIIRRGPGLAAARQPFVDVLGDFQRVHDDWLALHGDATIVPTLSEAAREAFTEAALRLHVPPANHRTRAMAGQQPTIVRVQPVGLWLRWSGDVGPDDIGTLWEETANAVEVFSPADPNQLVSGVAAAVVRLVLHSGRGAVIAAGAEWQVFADRLTSGSAHAEYLPRVTVRAAPMAGAARAPRAYHADDLSGALHRGLDTFVLNEIHRKLSDYLTTGRDHARVVGFRSAADLRGQMRPIWAEWRARFGADPALLSRFLRLMVCAEDDDDRIDEARVLVGPLKLPMILRATAAALAIAAAWTNIWPRGERPGNLSRAFAAREPWHGHACAADMIQHEPIAIAAASFIWRTHFVVLSQLNVPVTLATRSSAGLADVETIQPSITETDGAQQIILTLDVRFRPAAESGLDELRQLLASIEEEHFRKLRAAIV